jgi:integrase/recombinase XerD
MKKSQKPLVQHLGDFLDWLEIEKGLSSKTQENYSRFLKRFFDWLKLNRLEKIKPHEIKSEHIWKYRVFLSRQYFSAKKKNLKKNTQNYYLISLRSLLNYFADRDILSLPSEKIKLAKTRKEEQVRFLDLQQLEKLFSAPDLSKNSGRRDRAILEVLFSTGMRIAELVALNRSQIKIKGQPTDIELGIIGKGSRPRTVYFSKRAVKWLKEYLQTRQDKEKPLFINYQRKKGASSRLSARSIEKMVKKYALISGLPINTTPHVMRHSFATDLLSEGVDLRTVQEFLGHKTIAATQIYTHVTSKRLKDIHRRFHGDPGQKLR